MKQLNTNDDVVAVFSTIDSGEGAQKLARLLVENRLAACVNIVPGILSVYEWEGKMREEAEHLLVIKTRRGCLEAMKKLLNEHHPYDCPELVALPVTEGLSDYLDWVRKNTKNLS